MMARECLLGLQTSANTGETAYSRQTRGRLHKGLAAIQTSQAVNKRSVSVSRWNALEPPHKARRTPSTRMTDPQLTRRVKYEASLIPAQIIRYSQAVEEPAQASQV